MMKIIYFVLMVLFLIPAYFVSDAIGQDKDCRAIRDDMRSLTTDYRANYDKFREAHEKVREVHSQIYHNKYKATGKPLVDTYNKCMKEKAENDAFCKGAIEDFDSLEAKKKTAQEKSDAAEAISNEDKKKYGELMAKADEMGCLKKMKEDNNTDKTNKK